MEDSLRRTRFRFSRAKTVSEWLAEINATATALDLRLSSMNALFVRAEGVARLGSAVENLTSSDPQHQPDLFTPSFDVPTNPPHVVLNFGPVAFAPGEGHRHDISLECRLKLAILRPPASIEGTTSSHPRIVGMQGMSGVGKSCALRGLATDRDVRARFSDGVYWLGLGEDCNDADLVRQLAALTRQSGGVQAEKQVLEKTRLDGAVFSARLWFAGRRILLLVDDVWASNCVGRDVVRRLGKVTDAATGSCVAFTSRDLAMVGKEESIEFSTRDDSLSRDILFSAAGLREEETKALQGSVVRLLALCGGLPMALSVAGSAIAMRRRVAFNRSLQAVCEEYLDVLVKYRGRLLSETVDGDGYSNLSTAFTASLAMLDEKNSLELKNGMSFAEMYGCLAVIERHGWLPTTVLAVLWGLDEIQATEVVNLFAMVSLAERKDEILNGGNVTGLALHDLQLDFAETECKSHSEVCKLHEAIVQGWIPEVGSDRCGSLREYSAWATYDAFAHDYARQNVSRHLIGAGLTTQLEMLLRDPRWTVRRLAQSETLGLEEDFNLLLEGIKAKGDDSSRQGHKIWSLQIIVRTARLSAPYVSRHADEVWFQLYARLLSIRNESTLLQEYTADIERHAKKPWVKALTPCLSSPRFLHSLLPCGGRVCGTSVGTGGEKVVAWGICTEGAFVCTFLRGELESRVLLQSDDDHVIASTTGIKGQGPSGWQSANAWSPHDDGKEVSLIRCSGNGKDAVTVHKDGTVRAWAMDPRGHLVDPLTLSAGEEHRFALSPDWRRIASSGPEMSVKVWDRHTGEMQGQLLLEQHVRVFCLDWSPDGKRLALGGRHQMMQIWNVETGEIVGQQGQSSGTILCVAWSPDGRRIAGGGRDKMITVWDSATGEAIGATFRGHSSAVFCLAWSPNGKRLASGGWDKSVRIWDVETGKALGSALLGHRDTVSSVGWTPDGERVVSGAWDETVRIWDTQSTEDSGILTGSRTPKVSCAEWSSNGRFLASGGRDRMIRIWDVESGEAVGEAWGMHRSEICCLAWSRNSKHLASGVKNGTVSVWDVETRAKIGEVGGDGRAVTQLIWSAEGAKIVVEAGQERRVCDVDGWKGIAQEVSLGVRTQDEDPKSQQLSISLEGASVVYDSKAGKVTLATFERSGMHLRCSPSNRRGVVFSSRKFYFFEIVW
ncbi:WD40-repeat containing protein [Chondrus crispus]|uniref:WD40-repeat containing protein n=1 Tax=Chondrus crispus TaxID=2769 RepID=R7Q548_CHOCR|nr:WD40-repeat containing protein [Chondrus crispus]CDF32580.1 WD40-repeat containing protein [Chondrus crispus]|eukprot:XP_005712245.1 WD40-repeat containing protein [Chondrus crispus]